MRIVIDMQGMQTQSRYRGIGRYSLGLTEAMLRQAGEHEIWLVLNGNYPDTIAQIRATFENMLPQEHILQFHSPVPVSWDNTDNNWRRKGSEMIRESFLCQLQPDIVFILSLFEGATENACLSVGACERNLQTSVVLYDLIPLLDPKSYLGTEWTRKWYMDKINSLKQANLLLSNSEHTRQEAIDNLNIDEDRIVNISAAIADIFRPRLLNGSEVQILITSYRIRRPFIMYSGAFESRKNLDRLLEAFALLSDNILKNYDLVFVGKHSEHDRQHLLHVAQKIGIKDQLILTGYISDENLVMLYNQCSLFVFPSLYEGFGLPALEAMACGAPTIASNTTSIPEVIGWADALFDPTSTQSIADKIVRVLSNEDFRKKLREHGLKQAKKFSWDDCARKAINAFERLHDQNLNYEIRTWQQQLDEHECVYRKLIDSLASIPIQSGAPTDDDLVSCAVSITKNFQLIEHIARARELPEQLTWRIEGPFDSSYSLSLLNRETARAMKVLGHNVVLHSTDGHGDFTPSQKFLLANPDLKNMHARSHNIFTEKADVTSRNLYPPRVADMCCRLNLLHHYAWEESGFPFEWAEKFNEYLQGITCLSNHVKKIIVDSGVTIPISVSGCGVDHWERIKSEKSFKIAGKDFKLLHVSSCFPRKGTDLLLKAYGRAYTSDDDVTLIIKTFQNPHNKIHQWLAYAKTKQKNYPDVIVIEDELSDSQLKALYEQCHVLVAPSFAEGFGLPMAEAMLSGLAVITTGWGGQMDFCSEETAWLVDYTFELAQTHFKLFDSVWAVPNVKHLTDRMRCVYELPSSQRNERSQKGRALLLEKFRWSDTTNRLIESARSWARIQTHSSPRIGWITTWNTRCGIAAYSEHLVKNMSSEISILSAHNEELTKNDGPEVNRCWFTGELDTLEGLSNEINKQDIDIIVIQFNYSFFNLEYLSSFLERELDDRRKVVMMMHSTIDPIHVLPHKKLEKLMVPLRRVHRILVHTPDDLNRLKEFGLVDNVTLFPHGIPDYDITSRQSSLSCYTIASYGFFLPSKGLLELIDALALLRNDNIDVRLHMINAEYPGSVSANLIIEARKKISNYRLDDYIDINTEYLSDEVSLSLLADVDLIIFPYQDTGESSSAAVRYGLASGRPVAVTPIKIFDDVAPAVTYLPGQSSEDIALGIKHIIHEIACDSSSMKEKIKEESRWRKTHRYSLIGTRLNGMLHALNVSNDY